jgi:hypothetical protein
MDHAEQSHELQERLSTAERTDEYFLGIDPGFAHQRKIETIIGTTGMEIVDSLIGELPDLPDWQRTVRIDHIYTKVMLGLCEALEVPPLGQLLNERKGRLFTSTELLAPAPEVYSDARAVSVVATRGFDLRAELHYSAERIASTTLKTELHNGGEVGIVAELHSQRGDLAIFHRLVIGGPWLYPEGPSLRNNEAMWWGYAMGEVFVDDIDELRAASTVSSVEDWEVMARITEAAFKECLAEILAVSAPTDWGGEQSDLYTAGLSLGGKRTSAAFLLKGPARFEPMRLNNLGKNNDQIVRLSKEPASLLVVQHCHDIGQAVRDTLRAFAIQPGPMRRRYCLIDGKDSYKILKAYGKLDRAIELSGRT